MNKIDNLNNKKLDVSSLAVEQMSKILSSEKKGSFIRISVDSGGCSGFSYKFSVDSSYDKENDIKDNDDDYILINWPEINELMKYQARKYVDIDENNSIKEIRTEIIEDNGIDNTEPITQFECKIQFEPTDELS